MASDQAPRDGPPVVRREPRHWRLRFHDELRDRVELSDAAVRLGLRLSGYANNDTGRCMTSQPRMARDLGWSLSKTKRVMAELVDAGLVVYLERARHRGETSVIDLRTGVMHATGSTGSTGGRDGTGVNGDREPVSSMDGTGVTSDTQNSPRNSPRNSPTPARPRATNLDAATDDGGGGGRVEGVLDRLPAAIAAALRARHLAEVDAAVDALGEREVIRALKPGEDVRSPAGWTRAAVAQLTATAGEARRRSGRRPVSPPSGRGVDWEAGWHDGEAPEAVAAGPDPLEDLDAEQLADLEQRALDTFPDGARKAVGPHLLRPRMRDLLVQELAS